MDVTKVIIENWPKADHILEYLPIIIAVTAVAVSLYSAYLTRRAFIASHRPFVWASNYGVVDHDKKTITQIPHRIAYRVKNSPAKIISTEVIIRLNNEALLSHKDANIVRFPDESSEWSFSIGIADFERMMNRSNEDKAKLIRNISVKHSSLNGREGYYYELQQTFDPVENQWKDKSATAS
jgi:hypothetical protein